MLNLKDQKSNKGFTLMELLVVLAILGMMLGLILVNLAGQRTPRNLKIAQNQLATNLRKIQSYSLSGRTISNNQSVQYYVIKFDFSQPTQYTIQAIYNVSSSPQVTDIETVKLPQNIKLASAAINGTAVPSSGCALIAFAAPFGKIYLNNSCSPTPLSSNPYAIISGDYQKIAGGQATTDLPMAITLSDQKNTITRIILINSITGAVCPSLDGSVCSLTN